jgi:class 3 adenylate cyclase
MDLRLDVRFGATTLNLAWLGAGLAAVFWLLESLLHAFVFGSVPLAESVAGGPDANELWMRLVICALLVAFGWIAQRSLLAERQLDLDTRRLNSLMRLADQVREHFPRLSECPSAAPAGEPPGAGDEIDQLAKLLRDLSAFLEARFRELYALLHLTREINLGLLLEEVLDRAYDNLRSVLPYDRLGVALLEDDGRTVRARWARTNADELKIERGYAAPLAGSSLERILATGEPRILNDLAAYHREHPASESTRRIVEEGIRSSLTCPLISSGKPVGFMFFSSRRAAAYRDVHVEIFKLIAGHLSLVVEKSKLYQQILHEKENSERLLLNVIPARIAARLRAGEQTIAESLPAAGILFADLAGFTPFASRFPPEQVLRTLQDVFLCLDRLCDVHGIEKIKTIGDEYMAISAESADAAANLRRLAAFALDAVAEVAKLRYPDGTPVALRVGLHCGAAVAGVIGQKKFAYDIWGDAVNVASRMESHGEPGRVHVTAITRSLLEDRFAFEDRGPIEIKGKGSMRTSFLCASRREPVSA